VDVLVLEVRAEVTGDRLTGHAAVFGQYANIGGHLETIAPGAFDRALREGHDVRLTVGHDQNKVLARTRSGTLRLTGDRVGLRFDAELPDTTLARDVRALVTRGDLSDMSFAFVPTADEWSTRDGHQVQTITDLDLHDVSLVGLPAYQGTDVRLRALTCFTPPTPGRPVRLVRARARLTLGATNAHPAS
jgi:HK97 family phage prohead protease